MIISLRTGRENPSSKQIPRTEDILKMKKAKASFLGINRYYHLRADACIPAVQFV